MTQRVLVFMPGDVSQIGLWQTYGGADATWCTVDVPRGERGQATTNRVLTALDAFLNVYGLSISDITHIGVMRGPASYTELRLFVTTANTVAWVQGVPIFGFDPAGTLPEDLPHLIATAKQNQPIEPVYPPLPGA